MKSHLPERLYLSLPFPVQNAAVSWMGLLEHNRRYRGVCIEYTRELYVNEFKTREELGDIQEKLLESILRLSLHTVPYYSGLDIKKPLLENFPLLERSTVFDHPEQLVSERYEKQHLLRYYTGGSTGNPLTIYLTKDIRRKTYAFWNRFYRGMNFQIGDRKASFVGRKLQEPNNNKPPFWRYNFVDRQLLFSSFHLFPENIPLYIEKLNKFRPVIIEGYPLVVLRLAEFIVDNKLALNFSLNGVSTSSENFTAKQRSVIESAFGCTVYDQYGSAESVVFAGECEHKSMHIAPEYGVVEVLDNRGNLTGEGEGELVVTGLINDAMPLIRYRIGDFGTISHRNCPCGRNTAILEELSGKTGAVIVSGERRVSTAAIAIAFEYLQNVRKSQIEQNDPDSVVVRLATKPGFSEDEEQFMIWELRKMLGDELQINVERVDDIPPAENGKYQMVVQNYFKN